MQDSKEILEQNFSMMPSKIAAYFWNFEIRQLQKTRKREMTLTDDLEERSRTDNGNHKNAPLMSPPKEEVIRFYVILPTVYLVIMY